MHSITDQVARRLASPLDGAACHALHAITTARPDALALLALLDTGVTRSLRNLAAAGWAWDRGLPTSPAPDAAPASHRGAVTPFDWAHRFPELAKVLVSLTIDAGAHDWRHALARQDEPQPMPGSPWFGLERTCAPGCASLLAGGLSAARDRRAAEPVVHYRLLVVLPATHERIDPSAQTELTIFLAACQAAVQLRLRSAVQAELGSPAEPDPPTHASHRGGHVELTPTESLILTLLRRRLTEKQVAAELGRSPHTIHVHVKSIYRKMNVNTRAQLLSQLDAPQRTDPASA